MQKMHLKIPVHYGKYEFNTVEHWPFVSWHCNNFSVNSVHDLLSRKSLRQIFSRFSLVYIVQTFVLHLFSSLKKSFGFPSKIYFYCFSIVLYHDSRYLSFCLIGPFYFASPYKHAVVAIIMIIVRQMQWNVEWKEKQIPKWRRDKNNNPTSIGKSWAVAMARTRHTKLSILMLDRWAVVPQCAAISTESSLRFIVLHWTGFFCHSQCLGFFSPSFFFFICSLFLLQFT